MPVPDHGLCAAVRVFLIAVFVRVVLGAVVGVFGPVVGAVVGVLRLGFVGTVLRVLRLGFVVGVVHLIEHPFVRLVHQRGGFPAVVVRQQNYVLEPLKPVITMYVEELKRSLEGRELAIWTGKNPDGTPLDMTAEKRAGYVAFLKRKYRPSGCGCGGPRSTST